MMRVLWAAGLIAFTLAFWARLGEVSLTPPFVYVVLSYSIYSLYRTLTFKQRGPGL